MRASITFIRSASCSLLTVSVMAWPPLERFPVLADDLGDVWKRHALIVQVGERPHSLKTSGARCHADPLLKFFRQHLEFLPRTVDQRVKNGRLSPAHSGNNAKTPETAEAALAVVENILGLSRLG